MPLARASRWFTLLSPLRFVERDAATTLIFASRFLSIHRVFATHSCVQSLPSASRRGAKPAALAASSGRDRAWLRFVRFASPSGWGRNRCLFSSPGSVGRFLDASYKKIHAVAVEKTLHGSTYANEEVPRAGEPRPEGVRLSSTTCGATDEARCGLFDNRFQAGGEYNFLGIAVANAVRRPHELLVRSEQIEVEKHSP